MNQNRKCQHHDKETELFCETCKELVCTDCVSYGPHQTKNHKIIAFKDAYAIRQTFIRDRIETALKNKKESLIDQLEKIESRVKSISEVKQTIVKDIHMEFEGGILKRLDDSSGTLIAVLQKDIAWLQKHLNQIDDYIHTFEYLALEETNVLPLLFLSKTLSKQTMNLLSIIIKTDIQSHPSDLPRELLELRTKIKNSEVLQEQIELKKQIIWKCRADKIVSLEKIKTDFFLKMEDEIYDWVRLLKKVVATIDNLCLICTFCGCFIDVINEQCALNTKEYEEVQLEFTGYTNELPKMKQFGTCQHFYGYPRDEFLIMRKDQYANFGQHQEQRRAAKEVYFKVFRSLWFSIIDLKARVYLKQMNLREIFKKYDSENRGWLTIVKFKYLMHHELGMSVEEIERLVIYFRDEKEDKINYEYFLDVDWYIEELKRLEAQVKAEAVKYPKLYNRRIKVSISPTKQESKIEKPKQESTIYSSFTRFSQPVEKQPIPQPIQQPKFGFVERDTSQIQSQLQVPQKQDSTLKSKQKSSSLQPKRVQFEEKPSQDRFKESLQITGNHISKYY